MDNFDKKQIWHDVLEIVKISVSTPTFNTWFSQTHLASLKDSGARFSVEIGCATSFAKQTIETRYFGLIQDSLVKFLGKPCDLVFIVKVNQDKSSIHVQDEPIAPLFEREVANPELLNQAIKNARLRINFTFENFAVSSSNQLAHAAAEAVSQNPGTAYNPLFIWGGVGVGKTHLMTAVGHKILRHDVETKVYVCTGEEFTNDIVEGIRYKTTPEFRKKYRKLNVLLIDDIQFIAGKDAVQEEFFHTFNAVINVGGQIILTSDRPPSEIPKLENRLRNRFEAGLIVDIGQPDFELRCAILQIKSQERELTLPMDLIQLIAGNIGSPREIEGFLVKLISEVRVGKIQITPELIQRLLAKKAGDNGELAVKAKPNEVISAVAKYYSIGKRIILGNSRQKPIVVPRQILMYILRIQLKLPLEEIGRIVYRDHTTVMHAVEKITRLNSTDVNIREDLVGIRRLF